MHLEDEMPVAPLEGPADWLVIDDAEAHGRGYEPTTDESFDVFVEEHLGDLLRVATVAGLDPDHAPTLVAAALATAYRRWGDMAGDGDDHGALTEVAGLLATRIRHGENRRRRWDDAHDDRLAKALHEVLGLDERDVARALRIPELHAVARLARAGPVTSLDVPVRQHPSARIIAARARGRARARTGATAVTTAVVLALVGSAIGVHFTGADAPAAPISAGGPHAYGDRDVAAQPGGACPALKPSQPGRPVFDGPPLPLSVVLSGRDLAALGSGWHPAGGPHRAILPVYTAEDQDPVLPADQQSGVYAQLASPEAVVEQTVIRYADGTGGAAARQFVAEAFCHDDWHDLIVLQRRNTRTITTRVYAKQLLGAPRPPTLTWDVVVRSADVVCVVHVRGRVGAQNARAAARALVAAALRRLQRARTT